MHRFVNRPVTHVVDAPLQDSHESKALPFSRSYVALPLEDMIAAAHLLWTQLCGSLGGKHVDLTEEDLKFAHSLECRLKALREKDMQWRRALDFVLRCLHPDGCYFPYLRTATIQRVYKKFDVDPAKGVNALPLRDPERVAELAKMLEPELEKIERTYS